MQNVRTDSSAIHQPKNALAADTSQVHRHVSPAFTVYVVPFTEAVAVMVETNGRITTGAGWRQVATFPLRDTHEAES
jgi:hypothetical protein